MVIINNFQLSTLTVTYWHNGVVHMFVCSSTYDQLLNTQNHDVTYTLCFYIFYVKEPLGETHNSITSKILHGAVDAAVSSHIVSESLREGRSRRSTCMLRARIVYKSDVIIWSYVSPCTGAVWYGALATRTCRSDVIVSLKRTGLNLFTGLNVAISSFTGSMNYFCLVSG